MNKLFVLSLFVTFPLLANEGKSIEELEKLHKLKKAESSLKKVEEIGNEIVEGANERIYSCLKAFGHEIFCNCISKNLSVWVSFPNYLSITMSEENQRSSPTIDDDTKKTISHVFKVRNECVASSFN